MGLELGDCKDIGEQTGPCALFSDNVSRIETALKQPINAVTWPSIVSRSLSLGGQFRQILGNCCYVENDIWRRAWNQQTEMANY